MPTLIFMNPLKPGKLDAYKKFCATNTGPKKQEYADLLKRYGLNNARAFYHQLNGKEYIIVVHDGAEKNAAELLANWSHSTHPYDRWFNEQLLDLHDFESLESSVQPQFLFSFEA